MYIYKLASQCCVLQHRHDRNDTCISFRSSWLAACSCVDSVYIPRCFLVHSTLYIRKKKYITNHTHIHDNFYCKSRFAIVDSMKVQLSHETSNSIFIYASCSMFMYKPQTTSFTWMRLALSLGLRLESS